MSDKHDRGAGGAKLLHDCHQLVGFLRCQNRGWLIENQNLGIADKCLDDLNALLNAHGKIANDRIRVNFKAESSRNLAHLCASRFDVENSTKLGRFVAENHIFGDGENWDEHEVLVHHSDAG